MFILIAVPLNISRNIDAMIYVIVIIGLIRVTYFDKRTIRKLAFVIIILYKAILTMSCDGYFTGIG